MTVETLQMDGCAEGKYSPRGFTLFADIFIWGFVMKPGAEGLLPARVEDHAESIHHLPATHHAL